MPCQTPCDPDCEAECHEVHAPTWIRDHDPDDCGTAEAYRLTTDRQLLKALANLPDKMFT